MNSVFLRWAAILIVVASLSSAIAAQKAQKHRAEFETFLSKLDDAQEQFHNGDPAALEALWSHEGDATLAGGTGGAIEKGWTNVKKRLDTVTTHYSGGKQANERVDINVSGDFASVIQYEHIVFQVPGQTTKSKRDYRITMIFRYEKNGWRLVHRQADTQTEMITPK